MFNANIVQGGTRSSVARPFRSAGFQPAVAPTSSSASRELTYNACGLEIRDTADLEVCATHRPQRTMVLLVVISSTQNHTCVFKLLGINDDAV
jgi:hypothetical protein